MSLEYFRAIIGVRLTKEVIDCNIKTYFDSIEIESSSGIMY